jgi:glyoxylase-like metal-dependent hydrolase (beta-lactamase superfamily II)
VTDIVTIQTPSLGDRSYLVSDGATAFVVDPQRDIDRVLALAANRGISVTHVFETHIHNDYVTGGLALARATGAAYHVHGADAVSFDRAAVADGDVLAVGKSMRVRVIATPGHTFTHLAYALEDAATGETVAVFTGGSLLHGSGRIAAGEWVVDLRRRRAFAAGHLPGSLSFEYGDNLVANLGWLLPPGTPLTLIGESAAQVADAQRDLTRIGVDRVAGMTGPPHEWREEAPHLGSYPVSDFPALAATLRDQPVAVLDVRRRLEWSAGHIEGALHVPLHQLPGRLPDLPPGPIWVHCQAGYRASVAASILDAAGRAVTAVDDDFSHAAPSGLPLTTAPAAAAA